MLLCWEQVHGRDLISEYRSGRFLSVADVVSLGDFVKLDMRDLKSAGERAKERSDGVVDFLEARVALIPAQATIGGQQHFNRISTFADYLEFTASAVSQHRRPPRLSCYECVCA